MNADFPEGVDRLSVWNLACRLAGQNPIDALPTADTLDKLRQVCATVKQHGGVEWASVSPERSPIFRMGAGSAMKLIVQMADRPDAVTDWQKTRGQLILLDVRREDWERYIETVENERAHLVELMQEQSALWARRQPAPLYGEGYSEERRKKTTLTKYLAFDTWTPAAAAMLVCGLQAPVVDGLLCTEIPPGRVKGLDDDWKSEQNCTAIAEAKRVLGIWLSRENPPARVRPLDFIAWCNTKGIDTAWLRSIEEQAAVVDPLRTRDRVSTTTLEATLPPSDHLLTLDQLATAICPGDAFDKARWMLDIRRACSGDSPALIARYVDGREVEPGTVGAQHALPAAKQKEMMDFGMKYIALEASLKHVPLPEATDSFIGLAHMAGAYDPKQAKPLFESMLQASLTTHASLGQIARAASYALPALHAAGANSSDVMLLVTTMMQGGIMNTKSGTWLNAMASNALPNTLGAGMFSNKRQNSALHTLGLYAGNHALFYKNGSMDLMKLVGILAGDREKMEPLKFNALLKMAFGTQGQRAAAFFSEATALGNTHALAALNNFSQPPLDVGRMIQARSSIAAADQAMANFNMTLMNGTDMLLGPVNAALGGANSIFGWTAKYSKDHPIMGGMMDAGMLFGGAVGALGAWKGSKWAVGWTVKETVSLSKYLAKGSASLIARAASTMTSSEIGSALIASGAADAAAVAISGGIAYLVAHAATSLAAKALPVEQTLHRVTMGTALNELKSDFGLHVTAPPATAGAPQTHVSVHLDGKQIAAHVERKLVPSKSTGPSGFNGDATPYSPMMGMAP